MMRIWSKGALQQSDFGHECGRWPQSPCPDDNANSYYAATGLSGQVRLEKTTREVGYFIACFVESKVTGVEQMQAIKW